MNIAYETINKRIPRMVDGYQSFETQKVVWS
jgi:hypothetical protein|nr:MAG TPA: hypothetical protein [Caudoviricetes sp.]